PHSGKKVLELKEIRKSYGTNTVLNRLSLEVQRGEKLVVTGVNGAGKSTLLRIIASVDSRYQGEVLYGAGVTAGYFSQEQRELEESPRSIIDLFEAEAPTELVPKLRNLLGAFLFQGDDIYKPIKVLSGGERSRIALLRLLLQPHNLLILDEPTNHLDIHSKDVLLEALKKYAGTLVFVSHDRYFIEHLATRVLELGTEGPRNFPGDYQYYLYRLEQEAAQGEHTDDSSSTARQATVSSSGMSNVGYEELKQHKKRLRKLESEEQKLVGMMDELEQEHNRIQADMALPEVYSQAEKITQLQRRLNENEQEQAQLSGQWEAIALEKESLAKETQDR
ncbi:MAG TPA: ATP-binding cassette domain-containing protein, partial [Clostridia bacterium]|nr:ATP-binding cassette domain-containing protein [Clostridia bacterium]